MKSPWLEHQQLANNSNRLAGRTHPNFEDCDRNTALPTIRYVGKFDKKVDPCLLNRATWTVELILKGFSALICNWSFLAYIGNLAPIINALTPRLTNYYSNSLSFQKAPCRLEAEKKVASIRVIYNGCGDLNLLWANGNIETCVSKKIFFWAARPVNKVIQY